MSIPSFDRGWDHTQQAIAPRIQVIEIRDRLAPKAPPIAWLFFEREERYEQDQDGKVRFASIRLHFKRVLPQHSIIAGGGGDFCGSYSRSANKVSLTSPTLSSGGVFMDLEGLKGQRITTFFMNEIVEWVKQWADATVASITVLEDHGRDPENRARRNRLYEQFGLEFDYEDKLCQGGKSRPMLACGLTPTSAWTENISVLRVFDYLPSALYAGDRAAMDLLQKSAVLESVRAQLADAEKMPLRWALRRLWWRYVPVLLGWGLLALLGAATAWLYWNGRF